MDIKTLKAYLADIYEYGQSYQFYFGDMPELADRADIRAKILIKLIMNEFERLGVK